MSKNRMVNTRFWSDSFVVDKLNALDRYLFLYLLTNERTNIVGIYELSLRTAAFETGIERQDLEKMLTRLSPKIEYFDGWVYIRNFTDHQQINPNVEKGMMREVFNLPDNVIKKIISVGIDSPKLSKAFESLTKAFESLSVTKPELKPNLNLTKPTVNKATNVAIVPATPKVASKDIDGLFSKWAELVGYELTSQKKTNREYAAKLIREYPLDQIEAMLRGVAMSHDDQYAPRVANLIQLYRKWDDLKAWGKRSINKGNSSRGVKL